MLFMKKQFFDAIRSGRKTTTLRFWSRPQVRAGTVHFVRGLGRVHVQDVRTLREDELTDEHATADGFADVHQLRAALHSLYTPEIRQTRTLYLVSFRLMA